jgi:hypothetical protein
MAIIKVSPDMDITALIASEEVAEGDVLLLADGIYDQTVLVGKNYIRIVSEKGNAVFEGNDLLAFGVGLDDVTGVEISGVKIKNYVVAGVFISRGKANRILCNQITNIGFHGVVAVASSENLIWRNLTRDTRYCVFFLEGCADNKVLGNSAINCQGNAFTSYLSDDRDNAFIGNCISKCGGTAFAMNGDNCLLLFNNVADSVNTGFQISLGDSNVAINNNGIGGADGIQTKSSNSLIAGNKLIGNKGRGVELDSSFNVILGNLITCNQNSGLVIDSPWGENLIQGNRIACNTPQDIIIDGNNNNLVGNRTDCG